MSVTSPTVSDDPVVFDPYSDDYFDSPFETYRRMRDEAPLYYSDKYDFWALTRYADVAAAIKDHQTFSSAKGVTLDMVKAAAKGESSLGKIIISLDPPEHERMRKLVNRVFTPRAVTALESLVRETIDRYASQLDPKSFDAVEDFAALFPVEVITSMLGVPAADRQMLRHWLDISLERNQGMGMSQESMEAVMKSGAYYYELIQERRKKPQDDMISRLIETEVTDDGETRRLDDIEITGFCTMLGGAGAETVTKLVGNAVVVFADNPDQWRMLQEDRSKIPAAFEELLRYEGPSQYQIRTPTRDVTMYDETIPEGAPVLLINGSASRDERFFPDADRFDINRERKVGYNLNFGYGIHSCLGAALARMEGRMAIDTLLDLIPDYDIDRSGLQRVHMTNVLGWCNVPVRGAQTTDR
ncbi:cytochrome P450 [Mycolicibacterium sp. 120270]|uniref:cytochrome P450 n=1 Tax=Mycolicibacterium sp. 120270 TaxID=3090600 RepID=UPI00299E8F30|nr:cytochrome P450 [Mycolicibacterium sp. 120270]MDX1884327.1 cytochrome P450 [Mycolicibacterium sp. 120270]